MTRDRLRHRLARSNRRLRDDAVTSQRLAMLGASTVRRSATHPAIAERCRAVE